MCSLVAEVYLDRIDFVSYTGKCEMSTYHSKPFSNGVHLIKNSKGLQSAQTLDVFSFSIEIKA